MSGAGSGPSTPGTVRRNALCPCGSGRKAKHCCFAAPDPAPGDPAADRRRHLLAQALAAKRLWDAGRWAESLPLLLELVRLDPGSPHAHRDLGIARQRCGHLRDARSSLLRALELQDGRGATLPHLALAQAFADLAHALVEDGRDQLAAATYRDAARTCEGTADAAHYRAAALMTEGKAEQAEAAIRYLLADAPDRVGSRILLGHVLSQRGRFDEAVEHFKRSIALAPERPLAFEALTAARRMSEADRPLVDLIRMFAAQPGVDAALRITLHFGLGKAFDDLGDPAAAMAQFDAANRLKAASQRLDRTRLIARTDDAIAFFTASRLEEAARELARTVGPSDARPVFIIGMPRSGSTLVEQVLSSHPAVAAGGELPFWSDRTNQWHAAGQHPLDGPALARAAADYSTLLNGIAPAAARITDKALHNFALLWVIRVALPHARIIHCRRDPIDTCLSIFFTNFRARHDYAYDRGDLVFYYRQYERLMAHWHSIMPRARLTEIHYETLITDREAETRRLVAFCGLDWSDACLAPEQNPRAVNTASRWQVRQPVYRTSLQRWKRYEPWLGELRTLGPENS